MSTATATIVRDTDGPWGDTPRKCGGLRAEDNLEAERDAAIAKINERAERQRAFQVRLGQLQRAAAETEQRLANATDRHQHAVNRVQELKAMLLQLAGQSRAVVNVDPYQASLDAHLSILSLQASIEDWPRIKEHLEAELAAATQQLTQFQQRPK